MERIPANMTTVESIIKNMLGKEGDVQASGLMRYTSSARDVYLDLNLTAVRLSKRVYVHVDKKTNTAKVPTESMMLLSVCVEDRHGRLAPIAINSNIKSDIVDISLDKDCHCECGCNSPICGQVQNYEVIHETIIAPLPNGGTQSFDSVTRKKVNKDGSFVVEKTFPKAIYDNGVWVSTTLVTEEEFLCKLEVSDCGCIKKTDENLSAVRGCCGEHFFDIECGNTYYPMHYREDRNTYNVSETGDRIGFPSNFMYDRVLVRFLYLPKLKDMLVPVISRKAFQLGIKADQAIFNPKETNKVGLYTMLYEKEKEKVLNILNRFNLVDFYDNFVGHFVKMPKY